MATLTYKSAQATGTTLTPLAAASAGGDAIKPSEHGVLLVSNGSGAPVTVTVVTPGNDEYAIARPDITKSVAAAGIAVFGPFNKDLADPADGLVHITYSASASVTVGAFSV